MKFKRTKSLCEQCSLRDKNKIQGQGSFTSKIAFFGEIPSKSDDLDGKLLNGAAGGLLNWALNEVGIFRYQSWLSYTIPCRPAKGKIDSLDGEDGIKHCKEGFLQELEFLAKKGIKVIVPLGELPTNQLKIEGKFKSIRGSVYEINLYQLNSGLKLELKSLNVPTSWRLIGSFVIVPTFAPEFIFRARVAKGKEVASFKPVWLSDLKKAKEISLKGWNPPKENFNLFPSVRDLETYIRKVESSGETLAVDIETIHGFNMDTCKIVTIGLANSTSEGLCVPVLKKGGGQYWSESDLIKVKKLLNQAFKLPLAFQNALYDMPRLRAYGLEVDWKYVLHDTMIMHHSISPELPHDLGFIVSIYGQTPNWKENFWDDPEMILTKDDVKVRTYNLRDCVVLHQIIPEMEKDLINNQLEGTYQDEAMPSLKVFDKMISNGILFDLKAQAKLKRKLKKEVIKFEEKLYTQANLPESFNMSSGDHMRYFLYGIEPVNFKKIPQLEDFKAHKEEEVKCPNCRKKTWMRLNVFEPCSKCGGTYEGTGNFRMKSKRKPGTGVHQDLKDLKILRDKVKPLYIVGKFNATLTDSGKLSVGADGILSFQITLRARREVIEGLKRPTEKHVEEINSINRTLEWIKIFNNWKKVFKLENDFTKYKPSKDGRLHGSYLPHGTATGRPSMSKPNLMQVPKRAKEIRKMFIAKPGYTLISGDYSNLEVHVLAHETGEPNLIPVIKGEINQHDENTKILFNLKPGDPYWNDARDGAKVYQFARVQYGGGIQNTFKKVCMKCPNVDITLKAFKKADNAFFEKNTVLHAWQEQVKETARKTRVSQTFLGRKRILMGEINQIERQALNTPIQGGAAGIINRAMIKLDNEVERLNLDANIILYIYDQLVYEVRDDQVEVMTNLIIKEMERPLDFYGKMVSFPVDIEIGKNWGSLKELKR